MKHIHASMEHIHTLWNTFMLLWNTCCRKLRYCSARMLNLSSRCVVCLPPLVTFLIAVSEVLMNFGVMVDVRLL